MSESRCLFSTATFGLYFWPYHAKQIGFTSEELYVHSFTYTQICQDQPDDDDDDMKGCGAGPKSVGSAA